MMSKGTHVEWCEPNGSWLVSRRSGQAWQHVECDTLDDLRAGFPDPRTQTPT